LYFWFPLDLTSSDRFMIRIFYTFMFVVLLSVSSFATHERAGEITYKHISGLTYEVTIVTYTYSPSPADRPELEIKWGDGTSSVLPRDNFTDLTAVVRKNIYIGQHTYAGAATYTISMEDPNRNYGIINIPNSVNIPFYIETKLVINPFLGTNNSVQLLNPPLDYGCVNKLYVHNPAAYDPDGDSLSYKLTICKGYDGQEIPGYTFPLASNTFHIDNISGDLVWDTPVQQGEYNVAFLIEEWRNGQMIGSVERDMQILIDACSNNPPEIFTINDTCVEAGDTLSFEVRTYDQDNDKITLTATGGPFLVNESPAELQPNPSVGFGADTAIFYWETKCSHIRKSAYPAYFKAVDDSYPVSLTAYKAVGITVVGPAPENPEAVPLGNSIILSWDESTCENATGYMIYRKPDFYGFQPGPCEIGVPEYTGYKKIKEISGKENITYTDDNDGAGLNHGIVYCYMITAVFGDATEGYASEEVCAQLKKDLPIITNVSINNTNTQTGSVYIAWSKPTELDFTQTPGPFQYQVYRKSSEPGAEFVKVYTSAGINDTLYTDNNLNTKDYKYFYRIDFYNNDPPDNYFFIGSSVVAPSIYLTTVPSDQKLTLHWNDDQPWINSKFVIYRQNPATGNFDSIGYSIVPQYADSGLINGKEYCYLVKSVGYYSSQGMVDPIINYSQEICDKPVDNIPPCSPILSVSADCDLLINNLTWVYPDTCAEEELKYYIYYAQNENSDFSLIDSTNNTSYVFQTDPLSTVGCFTVTALDSLWNQSLYSNVECVDIDECGRIWFPNVITPNGDGFNDIYHADSINSVRNFKITIFNRWGTIVYKSDDPYFKWDGTDQNNGGICSPGTYFFVATFAENSLFGPINREVKGSITLLKD